MGDLSPIVRSMNPRARPGASQEPHSQSPNSMDLLRHNEGSQMFRTISKEKSPGNRCHQGRSGYIWCTLDLVIPCRVASQQSPAPFHQAIIILRGSPIGLNLFGPPYRQKSSNPKGKPLGLLNEFLGSCDKMRRSLHFTSFTPFHTGGI